MSPKRRRAWVVIALVCLLTATNIGLLLIRRNRALSIQKGTGDVAIEIQRERVQDMKTGLASEDLSQVVARIGDESGFMFPGYTSQEFLYQGDFEQMLSNRRVHKLIELLAALPKEKAQAEALKICNKMFEAQQSAVERILANHRDASLPKNDVSIIANKLGFGAGVFALAHWAPPDQVELLSKVVDGSFQAAASWGLIPSMNWAP